MSRAGAVGHLVRRFTGSVLARPLSERERDWVRERLTPAEDRLWCRMGRADRRHSHDVARRVVAALGDDTPAPVVAAALLHDVGKTEAGLGPYGRVAATLSAATAGREMAEAWSRSGGITRRIGLYLRHEEIGADMLALAGSDPLTVALVREWSAPDEVLSVPLPALLALREADDA